MKALNVQPKIALLIVLAFLTNAIGPCPAYASSPLLPQPGKMVPLSASMNPPMLKGIKVDAGDPFRFEFILDEGDRSGVIASEAKQSGKGIAASPSAPRNDTELKEESKKLIKYFLASLTVPEGDLWVNLSPYEKDRTIPSSFGLTEMGRDLLAQDYMLKQVTASLIYPEDEVGKKFWKRIYEEAQAKYGTTNIPVNTFNKVWIVPEKAVVYENAPAGTAYVVESRLRVMLEVDYLSLEKNIVGAGPRPASFAKGANQREGAGLGPARTDVNQIGSQIVREIVIPALTREVNEGANFAQLRQVYNSLILATWYKKKIKDSILSKVYADQNKVAGVGYSSSVIASEAKQSIKGIASSPSAPRNDTDIEAIYTQYLTAFKKGVYNYIKEEPDPTTGQNVPKKYFSGGATFGELDKAMSVTRILPALSGQYSKVAATLKKAVYLVRPSKEVTAFNRSLDALAAEVQQHERMLIDAVAMNPQLSPDIKTLINDKGYAQAVFGIGARWRGMGLSIWKNLDTVQSGYVENFKFKADEFSGDSLEELLAQLGKKLSDFGGDAQKARAEAISFLNYNTRPLEQYKEYMLTHGKGPFPHPKAFDDIDDIEFQRKDLIKFAGSAQGILFKRTVLEFLYPNITPPLHLAPEVKVVLEQITFIRQAIFGTVDIDPEMKESLRIASGFSSPNSEVKAKITELMTQLEEAAELRKALRLLKEFNGLLPKKIEDKIEDVILAVQARRIVPQEGYSLLLKGLSLYSSLISHPDYSAFDYSDNFVTILKRALKEGMIQNDAQLLKILRLKIGKVSYSEFTLKCLKEGVITNFAQFDKIVVWGYRKDLHPMLQLQDVILQAMALNIIASANDFIRLMEDIRMARALRSGNTQDYTKYPLYPVLAAVAKSKGWKVPAVFIEEAPEENVRIRILGALSKGDIKNYVELREILAAFVQRFPSVQVEKLEEIFLQALLKKVVSGGREARDFINQFITGRAGKEEGHLIDTLNELEKANGDFDKYFAQLLEAMSKNQLYVKTILDLVELGQLDTEKAYDQIREPLRFMIAHSDDFAPGQAQEREDLLLRAENLGVFAHENLVSYKEREAISLMHIIQRFSTANPEQKIKQLDYLASYLESLNTQEVQEYLALSVPKADFIRRIGSNGAAILERMIEYKILEEASAEELRFPGAQSLRKILLRIATRKAEGGSVYKKFSLSNTEASHIPVITTLFEDLGVDTTQAEVINLELSLLQARRLFKEVVKGAKSEPSLAPSVARIEALMPLSASSPALEGGGSTETKDSAMSEPKKGGIDFNSDKINLQVQNNGGDIKLNIDPAQLQQLQAAAGFEPQIVDITPLTNVELFLGAPSQRQ